MESAIGQTAQERQERLVGSGMHPLNFTSLVQYVSGAIYLLAIKNPLFFGGGFGAPVGAYKESDDDLLSQANAYYHWRGSVSPSCSGWEGVVPLCYGRQTKGGKKDLHGLDCSYF